VVNEAHAGTYYAVILTRLVNKGVPDTGGAVLFLDFQENPKR